MNKLSLKVQFVSISGRNCKFPEVWIKFDDDDIPSMLEGAYSSIELAEKRKAVLDAKFGLQ